MKQFVHHWPMYNKQHCLLLCVCLFKSDFFRLQSCGDLLAVSNHSVMLARKHAHYIEQRFFLVTINTNYGSLLVFYDLLLTKLT